ncbi:hypothetical protein FPV67DRAFT_1673904 [Lyophyllum atratum]|nr:hypothetical protein FPV67DRAFT_1673904 [Lyophyllum atratum]
MAQVVVKNEYQEALSTDETTFGNQLEEYDIIGNKVADLLRDGKFLQNGVDHNGKTNNLAHPSIGKICIQFFYTSDNGLACKFPEDFKDEVPENALALVLTSIYHCLSEWEEGFKVKRSFEGKVYRPIYETMLDIIDDVKKNPYHGAKLEKNRKKWARMGMKLLTDIPAQKAHHLGLRAKLD